MKSPFPKIEIKNKGVRTEIIVDGQPLQGVRGFNLSQKGGEFPVLTLDLMACDMTVDTACIPALPDVFAGWYELIPEAREMQKQGASDETPLCID